MASALTPLGTRTRAGFIEKYGKSGAAKFEEAMNNGLIDRGKMENIGLVADPDAASEATESPKSDAAEGEMDMPPGMMTAMQKKGARRPPTGPAVGRSAPGQFQKRPG